MNEKELNEVRTGLIGKILICTYKGHFEWIGTVGSVDVDDNNVNLIVNTGKGEFLGSPTLEEAKELIKEGKCTFKWESATFELRTAP